LNNYIEKLERRSRVDQAILLAEIENLKQTVKSNKRSLDDEDDNSQLKQLNHRFKAKEKELGQASEKIEKLNDAFKTYCNVVSKINESSDQTTSEQTTSLTLGDLVKAANLPESSYQTRGF
jgi:hypothetical protein